MTATDDTCEVIGCRNPRKGESSFCEFHRSWDTGPRARLSGQHIDLTPDAPTVTNAAGGKQSHLAFRFDLLDAPTMLRLAAIFHTGAERYGEDNWRLITTKEHLSHLLCHVFAYLAGNREDDHLGHALARALMAAAVEET